MEPVAVKIITKTFKEKATRKSSGRLAGLKRGEIFITASKVWCRSLLQDMNKIVKLCVH